MISWIKQKYEYMGEDLIRQSIKKVRCLFTYIPSTGYESARVICILAICFDGSKVLYLVINKGKKNTTESISGICVLQTEKA